MSKILKSTTLGNVKNGGIFKALGKEFVKLDADEHGCLVLAKDIWTKMPFRDGDDPECPNDLRRSDVMKYLSDRFTEFVQRGTPLDTFIPFKIDLQDTTGQTELRNTRKAFKLSAFPSGVITARAKCWPMLPPKLASTEQTFRSRRQCFLRKKRGFWYGMATVPRLSGFVEVTEW